MNRLPLYGTICIVVMMVAATFLLMSANPTTAPSLIIVIGMIASSVPAIIAAIFSERASRDIRNGVVVEKAKEGAAKALVEHEEQKDNE